MSISIKNLEDRVKALEEKINSGVGKLQITELFRGSTNSSAKLSQSATNFDAIFIYTQITNNAHGDQNIVFSRDYNKNFVGKHVNALAAFNYIVRDDRVDITYNWNNTTLIKFVYGLKLYYNFSTLIHFIFNLLTKKEVELL